MEKEPIRLPGQRFNIVTYSYLRYGIITCLVNLEHSATECAIVSAVDSQNMVTFDCSIMLS
jgi:hypothetical protein